MCQYNHQKAYGGIGFIAKRNIKKGEELRYDYDLSSYSKPEWYLEPDSDSEKQCESEDEQPERSSPITKLKRCLMPGCGVTVIKIWNHLIVYTRTWHVSAPYAFVYSFLLYTFVCLYLLTALSLSLERSHYVKKSNATVVYSDEQKGRRVKSSSRGKPFHKLDNEKFTELRR